MHGDDISLLFRGRDGRFDYNQEYMFHTLAAALRTRSCHSGSHDMLAHQTCDREFNSLPPIPTPRSHAQQAQYSLLKQRRLLYELCVMILLREKFMLLGSI